MNLPVRTADYARGLVPCACCKAPGQQISEDAWERCLAFNRELRRRNEPPIRQSEMALCDECTAKWREDRNRHAADVRQRECKAWRQFRDLFRSRPGDRGDILEEFIRVLHNQDYEMRARAFARLVEAQEAADKKPKKGW